MAQPPLRVILIAGDPRASVQNTLESLKERLNQRPGIDLIHVYTEDSDPTPWGDAEIAVVLGGDGSILRACRAFGSHQIPILGVNLGRLGFLADSSPEDIPKLVPQLEAREFDIVPHLMYECVHHHEDGTEERYLGLNEVSLLAGASLQMVDIELSIDGEMVTTFSGDGLIVSTPVGSTAHNLSAGGPILRQDLKVFVVTPICPHTLTIRPIVDRATVEYVMTVPQAPPGVMLVVDGQVKVPFLPGDRVTMRQADVSFQLVRLHGHSFYGTLHRKLGWHGQPRYRRPRRGEDRHEGE
ncbi:NAD(+)/NADH kinase [Planctomicrobium sp. SH661]|uniref:NAD(+)/NADH kinase n=1 Tax=Planctomicrobium sp. SH661 TaxID=3448124 RepID=UPI003F5C69EF